MTDRHKRGILSYRMRRCHIQLERLKELWATGVPEGYPNKDGYRRIKLDGKTYLMHRMIFLYHNGYLPPVVDHEDRDTGNNSPNNLRNLSKAGNRVNSEKIKGIKKHGNKFQARIFKDGKYTHLGTFANSDDAIDAYQTARDIYYPNIFIKKDK